MRSSQLVDTRRGVDVLEAAAAEFSELGTWIEHVQQAMGALVPSKLSTSATMVQIRASRGHVVHLNGAFSPELIEQVLPHLHEESVARRFFFDASHVCTLREAARGVSEPEVQAAITHLLSEMKTHDVIALGSRVGENTSLVLATHQPAPFTLDARTRLLLSRLALHVEAGLRLRVDPSALVAVLRPDGRLVHAEGQARDRSVQGQLARHVVRVDKQRTRSRRVLPESVETWTALVSGRFGFIERTGVQREYLVFENPPHATASRRLSAAEARAVELSAVGLSGKMVAYALGVSQPAVTRLLTDAAQKLGCGSRTELVALAAQLGGRTPRVASAQRSEDITPSEREVLRAIREGRSNSEIAQLRRASVHTVANQVASLLRKTGLPSRRALATLRLD